MPYLTLEAAFAVAVAVQEGDLDAVACQPAVEAAMGAALQALGPEAVLEVLPLGLQVRGADAHRIETGNNY
jgi:hypothetical protein